MAASARRSEYDSAATVVGSDRTLTLNVEIAGSSASHGKARNRFVTHFNAFTSIAIVSDLVPCFLFIKLFVEPSQRTRTRPQATWVHVGGRANTLMMNYSCEPPPC
jgi:hypothetical protein